MEPEHSLIFLKNSKDRFIYQTRNNGYNHAYLYNTNGKLIKQITKGEWEITKIVEVYNNAIFYMSTEESPIERHLYKININTGDKVKLTQELGTHNIILNTNSKNSILIERFIIQNQKRTSSP